MKGHVPGPRPVGRKKAPAKEVEAWAGFVNGRIDDWLSGFYDVEHMAIFRTLNDAERCHKDVRKVRIILED